MLDAFVVALTFKERPRYLSVRERQRDRGRETEAERVRERDREIETESGGGRVFRMTAQFKRFCKSLSVYQPR